MANLFHSVFDGHLTADATFRKIGEDKGVINFTVAHNFPTSKKDENQKTIYEPQFYNWPSDHIDLQNGQLLIFSIFDFRNSMPGAS